MPGRRVRISEIRTPMEEAVEVGARVIVEGEGERAGEVEDEDKRIRRYVDRFHRSESQ